MAMVKINRNKIHQVIASVDWGFTNPGVIQVWAVDNDKRMYLIHEVYRTRKLLEWWIDEAKMLNDFFKIDMFVCDPAEPGHIQSFNEAGLTTTKANNDIRLGIQVVQSRLRIASDGLPRLFIMSGSLSARDEELTEAGHPVDTNNEFSSYVYAKTVDGKTNKEEPQDLYNHAMDCVRYAAMYLENGNTFESIGTLRKVNGKWLKQVSSIT